MTDWDAMKPKLPAKAPSPAAISKPQSAVLDRLSEKYAVVSEGVATIALDRSGSMNAMNKLAEAKLGALDFVRAAIGYQVGLLSFGSDATLHLAPTTDRPAFERAIAEVQCEGNTDMAGALELANSQLVSAPARALSLVLVTDGYPNDKERTLAAAQVLKARKVQILVIGTKDADWDFLKLLASTPEVAQAVDPSQLRLAIGSSVKSLPRIGRR